jgi:hypothetical protein
MVSCILLFSQLADNRWSTFEGLLFQFHHIFIIGLRMPIDMASAKQMDWILVSNR